MNGLNLGGVWDRKDEDFPGCYVRKYRRVSTQMHGIPAGSWRSLVSVRLFWLMGRRLGFKKTACSLARCGPTAQVEFDLYFRETKVATSWKFDDIYELENDGLETRTP